MKFNKIIMIMFAGGVMFTSCAKQEEIPQTIEETSSMASEAIEEPALEISEQIEEVKVYYELLVQNNDYNVYTCYADGYLYMYDRKGIYRLADSSDDWETIYDKENNGKRGIEIWNQYLYFCDYDESLDNQENTGIIYNNCIKRMDLETLEIEIIIENVCCYDIKFLQNAMYVKTKDVLVIGYELDDKGYIKNIMEDTEEEFLYSVWNQYYSEYAATFTDTSLWSEFVRNKKEPIADSIYVSQCTGGMQLYATYENELMQNIILYDSVSKQEEKLFETIHSTILVTPEGIYYYEDERMNIGFYDWSTKESSTFYKKDLSFSTTPSSMGTFDSDYIYEYIGNPDYGYKLARINRMNGKYEEICELTAFLDMATYHCSVYDNLFFMEENEEGVPGVMLKIIDMNQSIYGEAE